MTTKEQPERKGSEQAKIFAVPYELDEIKGNIIFTNSKFSKLSKEEIIRKATNLHMKGNILEAEKYYNYCLDEGVEDPRVFANLGLILKDSGKLVKAELLTRKAIELKPDFANTHYNLGNILKDLGKLKEAEHSIRKAIELKPDFINAYLNLGNILKDLDKLKEAELSIRKAIELKPDFARAHYNLGNILIHLSKFREAEVSNNKAIELKPDFVDAYINLGKILRETYRFDELSNIYNKNKDKWMKDLNIYSMYRLFFSPIILDNKEINKQRKNFKRSISEIYENSKDFFLRKDLYFPTDMFYLAYHNRLDDRFLLEDLARSLSKVNGIVNRSFDKVKQVKNLSKRNRIRLGICSDYLCAHTIGVFFTNLIKDLASSGIEVIIFRGPSSKKDEFSSRIDSFVSQSIDLPDSYMKACRIILNKSLDIMFYPDLGMSSYTYLLSLSRLALVQFTSIGHPSTSGSPAIDYYVSAKNLETEHSEKYYSEKLIRLSRLTCNHSERKIISSNFKRSDLKLKENAFLIGLPHSLFKFHPDYDQVLDQILYEIPNSNLLFINGSNNIQTQALKSRMTKNTKLLLKRSIFYPRVDRCNFLEIIKNLDIVLDPIYFGMGNTFYDSMQFGIPVVTMPNDFQRTRNCIAGYKQMGIEDPPIANNINQYVEICKKLAFDKEYKNYIVKQILSKSKKFLFNDNTIYKEYLQFFKSSLNAAIEGRSLPSNWRPENNTIIDKIL